MHQTHNQNHETEIIMYKIKQTKLKKPNPQPLKNEIKKI
jgi:hypothetical protein